MSTRIPILRNTRSSNCWVPCMKMFAWWEMMHKVFIVSGELPFENILQFQKDYDDVKVVKLEQNYRSTQSILHVANEVIRIIKARFEKVLLTENARRRKDQAGTEP